MPTISLTLTPHFDEAGGASFLDLRMVFDAPHRQQLEPLLHHFLKRGVVKTQQYDAAAVHLRSSSGPIELHTRDSEDDSVRDFVCDMPLRAQQLTVEYRAFPAKVNRYSPCGPQIALEADSGGLSGCGRAFILTVVDSGDTVYDFSVDWNLSNAPSGTRAICSWGEGPRQHFRGKSSRLEEAMFMVGPVNSYPNDTTGEPYGMYWISKPSFDTTSLGRRLGVIVPQMASFFHDDDPLFRIFIRHVVYKCNSGIGLHRGFAFAWNNIQPREGDLTEFLYHEISHNWPRLGFKGDQPTEEDMVESWFNEGIAEYYSLILPYRFGDFTEQQFTKRFNGRISNYYTNPDRYVRNEEVPAKFWGPGHFAQVPYQRGFMYFVALCYKLHRAGGRSLDDLVLEMIELRRSSRPHDVAVWLSLVEREIGPQAHEDYRSMSDAKLIRLPRDCIQIYIPMSTCILEREDQEEFYLGFPEQCLRSKSATVQGLDSNSRAAAAGVREGDSITRKFSYLWDADHWGRFFTMTVVRSEQEVKLRWWPRTWKKVESYQFSAT